MADNSADPSRRVVITGIGVVSPLGMSIEAIRESVSQGRSGVRRVESIAYLPVPGQVGAEAWDFDEKAAKKTYLKPVRKSIKVMCREIELGVASAMLAAEHGKLETSPLDHARLGVEFGANLMFSPPDVLHDGCWACVDEEGSARAFHFERWGLKGANAEKVSGMSRMEPLWLLKYLPNMPACHIAIGLDARGPSNSITQDEASGNLAIGEALRVIARGHADAMLAGTTGTRLQPVKSIHAAMWDELAEAEGEPATWSRPFDRDRTGQVIAEGACTFILETEESALARGVPIYGEVLGAGSSCVVDRSGKANPRRAIALAMQAALRDAGLQPADVGHINAHGLGSRLLDVEEAGAIHDVFGELAKTVPVTAPKSFLGNSGSGSGTQELAVSLACLRDGLIPQTLNYTNADPECPLNIVHGEPQATENLVCLNVSVTRMGQASAVVVRGRRA